MKSKIKILSVLAIFLISIGCKNGENLTTQNITLTVDTGQIENGNLDKTSNFGQKEGVSNSEFTISAQLGDTIVWKGTSLASSKDNVLITSINHQGGARVFGKNTLRDTREHPGVVYGVVSKGKKGDSEKYTISFKVLNDGNPRNGTFHIDPKIQIRN